MEQVTIAGLVAAAKDRCEGCRTSWRLKGWRHAEPLPIECQAKEIRRQLRNIEAHERS